MRDAGALGGPMLRSMRVHFLAVTLCAQFDTAAGATTLVVSLNVGCGSIGGPMR